MPPFNLGDILQPFNAGSPVNIMSLLAQAGIQNPTALASILAAQGAQPPATAPGAGGAAIGRVLQGAQPSAGPVSGSPGGIATAPAPRPVGGQPPGGQPQAGPGLEGLLTAVSKLKAPPTPPVAQPPRAIAPGTGGPGLNPELLARIMQLLQGGQAGAIPSLGQLISGRVGAPAAPTLTL